MDTPKESGTWVNLHKVRHLASAPVGAARLVEDRLALLQEASSMNIEATLRLTQDRLLTAQRLGKIGNWDYDVASDQVWWSEQVYRMFDVTPGSTPLRYEDVLAQVYPADLAKYEAAQKELWAGGRLDIEHRILIKTNEVRWVHGIGESVVDAEGKTVSLCGTVQDITERKEAECMLALEYEVLQSIALDEPLGKTLDKVVMGVENFMRGALGSIHVLSLDGQHLRPGSAPTLPPAYSQAVDGLAIRAGVDAFGTAAPHREAVVVEDIQTDPRWAEYRDLARAHGLRACWWLPVQDASGRAIATFGVYYREPRSPTPKDVALVNRLTRLVGVAVERHRKNLALSASEKRFKNIFKGAATGIATTDRDGRFLDVNAAYCQMTGYSAPELYGMNVQALSPEDDRERDANHFQKVATVERKSLVLEKKLLTKRGGAAWVRVSISPLSDAEGQPNGTIRIAEDITERKAAFEALREAQSLLKMASRVGRLGGWTIELPDRKLTWSDETCAMHDALPGYQPTLNDGITTFLPEHRAAVARYVDQCARHGTPYEFVMPKTTVRGRVIWVRCIGEAVRDASGKIVRIQGAFQDITEQKKAEIRTTELEMKLASAR